MIKIRTCRFDQLIADLDNSRGERNQMQAELIEARESNQTLQVAMERLRAEKVGIADQLTELQRQRDTVTETVDQPESDRTTLLGERDQLTTEPGAQQQVLAISELQLQPNVILRHA